MESTKIFYLLLLLCSVLQSQAFVAETSLVAEATEIIGVVRIGVSLVEYIYKVFANILRDSGAADEVIELSKDEKVEKRLLTEYRVISDSLDRLGHGYEMVEDSIRKMHQEFPLIIR